MKAATMKERPSFQLMAVIGGAVAGEYGVTREMQDAWSYRSQKKRAEGEAKGAFDDERFPVEVKGKKGAVTVVSKDEAPRPDVVFYNIFQSKRVFANNSPTLKNFCALNVIKENRDNISCMITKQQGREFLILELFNKKTSANSRLQRFLWQRWQNLMQMHTLTAKGVHFFDFRGRT